MGAGHRGSFHVTIFVIGEGRQHSAGLAVVEKTAGSDNVHPFAIVGIACGREVIGHGCDGKHFGITAGVNVTCRRHIACSENTETAKHAGAAGCCLGKVVDGVEHGLLVITVLGPPPRTLGD